MYVCVRSAQMCSDLMGRTLLPLQFKMLTVTLVAPCSALVQGSRPCSNEQVPMEWYCMV